MGRRGGDGTVPPARALGSPRAAAQSRISADARDVRRAADGAARGFGRRPRRRRAHHPGGARRVRRNRDERLRNEHANSAANAGVRSSSRCRHSRRSRGCLRRGATRAGTRPRVPAGKSRGRDAARAGELRRVRPGRPAVQIEWACLPAWTPPPRGRRARRRRSARRLAEAPNPPRRFSRRSFRRGGRARRGGGVSRTTRDARRFEKRATGCLRALHAGAGRGVYYGSYYGVYYGSYYGVYYGSYYGVYYGVSHLPPPPTRETRRRPAASSRRASTRRRS